MWSISLYKRGIFFSLCGIFSLFCDLQFNILKLTDGNNAEQHTQHFVFNKVLLLHDNSDESDQCRLL